MLNIKTLPVRYSDNFYRDLISNYSNKFLQYAFYNGFVVGSVCARVESMPTESADPVETEKKRLYIMSKFYTYSSFPSCQTHPHTLNEQF